MMTQEQYDSLLARVEKAELQAFRANAAVECQNVASKFFWYHACFRDDLIVSEGLWAKKAEDVHAEYGLSGVYKGYENCIKFHLNRPQPAGKILFHAIDTPVIEVAGDGKTAKGVWLLHGAESGSVPADDPGLPELVLTQAEPYMGKRTWAHWAWAKYAIDFIYEDGKWRIWHFHGYDFIRAPFDMDWVNFAMRQVQDSEGSLLNSEGRPVKFYDDEGNVVYMDAPDAPPTFDWIYDGVTSKNFLFPVPPQAYEHFDETFSY